MTNPFTPPKAPVEDPRETRKASPFKAVLLGLAVDIGGTLLVSVALGIVWAASQPTDQPFVGYENLPWDSWVMLAGLAGGCLCSVAGGYVCARQARENEFALGAVMAVVGILAGILMGGASDQSLVFHVIGAVLTFLAVMFGVRLGVQRNQRP